MAAADSGLRSLVGFAGKAAASAECRLDLPSRKQIRWGHRASASPIVAKVHRTRYVFINLFSYMLLKKNKTKQTKTIYNKKAHTLTRLTISYIITVQ